MKSKKINKPMRSKKIASKPKKLKPNAATPLRANAKGRAKSVEAGHCALERLPKTKMNFIELEVAIDEFWRRNVEARERIGLRTNQDVRLAERPAEVSEAEFDKICWAISDASYGFLEGLAGLWGHSVNRETETDGYIQLTKLVPLVCAAAKSKKAKGKALKRKQ